ncbi:hypothetical protein EYR36_001867 [Pleurotus pulmonarius]|nr:hypothetical protein EYR36_001867 [Pleurotus pulmonarius]
MPKSRSPPLFAEFEECRQPPLKVKVKLAGPARPHEPRDASQRTSFTINNSGEKPPAEIPKSDKAEGESDVSHVLIVDWDGADDPLNPKNWSYKKKWAATTVVSSFTLISPVWSSMIAPAAGAMSRDFGFTSSVVTALTISVFVLAYAIGPLFLGLLSEIFGRSRVVRLANLFYLGEPSPRRTNTSIR